MRRRAPRTPRLVTKPELLRLSRQFAQRFLSLRLFGLLVSHQMLEQDAVAQGRVAHSMSIMANSGDDVSPRNRGKFGRIREGCT